MMPRSEGFMEREGLRTWYRVVGDPDGDPERLPVVICHGGPGLTHDYLESLEALGQSGRACVFYDQYGSGRSGRAPDAPASFWTVELFVRELTALTEHLGLGGYHVLGHSWGGMLALELAARRPAALRSVIVASAFASSPVYQSELARQVRELPAEAAAAIERHDAGEAVDPAEYGRAVRAFYGRHVCRARPLPAGLLRTMAALDQDSAVYRAMAGASEFSMTGTLREWDISARLGLIEVPVLLLSGRHDEVTPRAVAGLADGLADSRWVLFEESSHMAHIEQPDRFLQAVGEFLADTENVALSAGRLR
jgi:L-proline amide hydrolase